MRKIASIIALAFIMASCSSSRCGCPNNLGFVPESQDFDQEITVLLDEQDSFHQHFVRM